MALTTIEPIPEGTQPQIPMMERGVVRRVRRSNEVIAR